MATATPIAPLHQFTLLAAWNLRILRTRIVQLVRHSKLMALTLAAFTAGYCAIGYILFSRGLTFIVRIPAVGGLLSERLLYLTFFFIFVMLAVSNAAVQYGSLFRSRESGWLLTLPIDHRVLYFWKFLESLAVSSWGFFFISAPLLAAFGNQHDAGWGFYVKASLLIFPFVAIPAALSGWLLAGLLRFARRSWLLATGLLLLLAAVAWGYERYTATPVDQIAEGNIVLALNAALRHTQISTHPLMPSTWWTHTLIQWVKELDGLATFNAMLLLSNALMALLVTFVFAGSCFYPAWNRLQHRTTTRRRRQSGADLQSAVSDVAEVGKLPAVTSKRSVPIPFLSRATLALMRKDIREFVRETAQWIQVAVVFGLLLVYMLNIRNLGYDITSTFWTTVISILNFTVCALALSTLTTRFVFPQFSIEGRRLWIVGMAPFPLSNVLLQKLALNLAFTAGATLVLMLVSGLMLELPWTRIAFFLAAITLMSFGLNALAISLGALFPNFEETNPAKVVSGFGGTLCLIASFIYLTLFIAILTAACAADWVAGPASLARDPTLRWGLAALATLLLSACFAGIPLFFAINRVKRLELLGNL